jgi:hypothetical protein
MAREDYRAIRTVDATGNLVIEFER